MGLRRRAHGPTPEFDPEELRERSTVYHLRLVAEELFLLQVGISLRRSALASRRAAPFDVHSPELDRALRALPFTLTKDQLRAWDEIAADLARTSPMNRLLVGDVGTGKTVLALLSSVAAHVSGALTAVNS